MPQPSISVGQFLGHYRILEKIGGGSQGDVYRARDERFEKDVALKILPAKALADDAARKQLHQEALAVGKLNHSNIATAFYFGEENGVDFLVTEYISGNGLDEMVKHGPLPEETVCALGAQLASGLEAAHREGIIHRDLKPGNLRITDDGRLKILDFGLAELVDPGIDVASAETVTLNMSLTGTLPYMAPEQFEGLCDQRSDLWAAGVVLYEMATGQRPFPEAKLQRLKDAILHREPARPAALNPAISQSLESVILRALQKDPKRRYQTAKDLREDLARVAAGQDVKGDSWLRGNSVIVVVAAVLIGILAYATHRFWPQGAGPQQASYRVLAVLPIESGSQDPSEVALVRGVAETVSARIAQGTNGRALQLIPPNELSAQGVKTAEEARRAFNVDRVLTVALQRSGEKAEKMRVTCSLVDPRTHQQMDARTLTGDASDLFTLEDDAVAEVFVMLPPDTRSEQPTPSEVHAAAPAAYEYYVRGRGYLQEYQKSENIDAAIKEFDQALKVSPNYAPAYAGLGEAYWRGYKADRGKNWLDKAKVNCEKALAAGRQLAEAHTCLGNLYNDTGKYQEAVDEFQRALTLDHDSAASLNGLALAYDRLEKVAAAEEAYKKAIAARPEYWAVYNSIGVFYYGRARYSEAEAMFRKAAEMAPGNQKVLYNLGAMYLLEGRYQDAIPALQRSIALRPTMQAYSNLGAAYFYLHKFPESTAALRKAAELDDQDYLNWGNLADTLYWTPGRRPEASELYRKAIALARSTLQVNPKDSGALACVASYSAMLGDRGPALSALQQALAISPNDTDVMFRAALVYNHFDQREQTLEWVRKATAGGFSRSTVRDTPDFGQLQQDPSFRALVKP